MANAGAGRNKHESFQAVKHTNGLFRAKRALCKHWPRHIFPTSPESNSARGNSRPTPPHFAAMAYFFLIYGLLASLLPTVPSFYSRNQLPVCSSTQPPLLVSLPMSYMSQCQSVPYLSLEETSVSIVTSCC